MGVDEKMSQTHLRFKHLLVNTRLFLLARQKEKDLHPAPFELEDSPDISLNLTLYLSLNLPIHPLDQVTDVVNQNLGVCLLPLAVVKLAYGVHGHLYEYLMIPFF